MESVLDPYCDSAWEQAFASGMAKLCAAWPHLTIGPETWEVFREDMQDFDAHCVAYAFRAVRDIERDFFPTIALLRRLAREEALRRYDEERIRQLRADEQARRSRPRQGLSAAAEAEIAAIRKKLGDPYRSRLEAMWGTEEDADE